MEVYPVINAPDYATVERNLRTIRSFLPPNGWIHVDIADAKFTPHKTWNDPRSWANLKSNFNIEVHLMVEDVEHETAAWVGAGAKRIIVHYEALIDQRYRGIQKRLEDRLQDILNICFKEKAELFFAVNPETPVGTLIPYFKKCAGVQTLAVYPGLAGQKFQPLVIDKISFLRKALPDVKIELDGGVTPEVARRAKEAGADIVVSSSYLLKHSNPKQAYEELRNA